MKNTESVNDAEQQNEQDVGTQVGIQPAGNKDPKDNPPAAGKTEIGGRKKGLEPTRYGDWEKNGRCIDF